MSHRFQIWIPCITLLLLALISGVAWRAELELRGGWAGLTWIGYFHWSIPASVFAFLVWVMCVTRVHRPLIFAVSLLVFSMLAFELLKYLIHSCFFIRYWSAPDSLLDLRIVRGVIFLLFWPLLPLAFCALCRGYGVPIKVGPALASAALCSLSWPLASFVRSFIEQRGGQDFIHALKSGFVIPLLILSLGLPLLCARRQKIDAPH
ncbi:hypothetical protein [Prosthecobacter sp.]|uniref:hypothetical protein n=1 Tax=Prosthecobacter sp. TaxID=1965333 RepID=UPI003783CA98